MPRTATTAANPATSAGLSAPPRGAVAFGGVTEFVGETPAVPFEVVERLPVLLADGIMPLETLTEDAFADTCAKPELAVTIAADVVGTTVALPIEEEDVGADVVAPCAVAEYADTSSSYPLTRGAISCLTSVASAWRKLVMTGWREDGMAVTKGGKGAEEAVM